MTELRPYQQVMLDEALAAIGPGGCRSIIIPAPTGSGKTVVGSALIKAEIDAGGHVVVLVHRTELVDQMISKLFAIGICAGVIKSGCKPDSGRRVQVCSVQTLHRRAIQSSRIEMPRATLVVVDECHHARARTWRQILEAMPDARIVGDVGAGVGDVGVGSETS